MSEVDYSSKSVSSILLRIAASVAIAGIALLQICNVGRDGLVNLLVAYAANTKERSPVDAALKLSRSDAEIYHVRGAIVAAKGEGTSAEDAYRNAVRLRPADYVLWLLLAHTRELNGDTAGAIAAEKQAVSLAPFYARPHWELGHTLVRAGQWDEGLRELAIAGAQDVTLVPSIIDLEWQLSGGDLEFIKRNTDPKSPAAYILLADYFKKHGKPLDAIEMLRAAGASALAERRSYLQELISSKNIKEAALLWSIDHPQLIADQLINPGFELESNLDEPGFGWRREGKPQSLSLTLDQKSPLEGRFSLNVEFNGASDPSLPVISQLIVVSSDTSYQLQFFARTDKMVSGTLPYVAVIDANTGAVLRRLPAFPASKTDWQPYRIDFKTGSNTAGVQITLRRDSCGQPSCPIFGHLWLDNFTVKKL